MTLLLGGLLFAGCEEDEDGASNGEESGPPGLTATINGSAFESDSSAWFGQAVGSTVTILGRRNGGDQVLTLKIADRDTGSYEIRDQLTGDDTATLQYEDGDQTLSADTGEVFITRLTSTYIDGSFSAPDPSSELFVNGGEIDSVEKQ
jgi:hypothetical protein